jgi:hypothetical protein
LAKSHDQIACHCTAGEPTIGGGWLDKWEGWGLGGKIIVAPRETIVWLQPAGAAAAAATRATKAPNVPYSKDSRSALARVDSGPTRPPVN